MESRTEATVDILDNYILRKSLGYGLTSKVKLGIHKETGTEVAIKIIKKEFIKSHEKYMKYVLSEISTLSQLHN